MGERRGTKALELWCRRVTEGYPGVKVDNMTTSWRDGLAFCALIHHFRPDLIDFSSLKKEDVYRNNELAFRTAESYLGIPALLDAEDMAQYAVPDRLSILTYLSQYYQYFASSSVSSPSRLIAKRPASKEHNSISESPSSSSPPSKMMSGALARREPCVACGQPVFLAQRLLVDRRLYHRTCFRCARCGAQLTLSGCYQTETDGQYCCETCPDEEVDSFTTTEENYTDMDRNSSFNQFDEVKSDKTLSDEEKFNLKLQEETEKKINANFDSKINPKWESSVAFTGFVSNYLHQKDSDDEDVLPALPTSLPPDKSIILHESISNNVQDIDLKLSGKPSHSDECSSVKSEENLPVTENNALSESFDDNKLFLSDNSVNKCEKKISVLIDDEKLSNHDNSKCISEEIEFVDIKKDVNISSDQLATASLPAELTKNINEEIIDDFAKDGDERIPEDLKETKKVVENSEISLVKSRMKIFEGNDKISIDKSQCDKIKNSNNRLLDQDVNINNRISDSRTDESNFSNVTTESNSLGDIEILKNSSDIKSDEYNIELPCSDIISNVPLNEGENIQSTDKFNDTELIPGAVSEISLTNNIRIQPDVSQDNEKLKNNDMCEEDEECEKNIEDLDTVVQENQLLNNEKSDAAVVLEKSDNIQLENNQSLMSSENISIDNLVTEEPKYDKNENKKNENYPEHLNPFSDDEGDDENADKSETSKNPFECSSDENENEETAGKSNTAVKKKNNVKPPRPPPPVFLQNSNKTNTARRVITAPFISLNPFSSDEDGNSDDENTPIRTPVPTPRQSLKGIQDPNSTSTSFLGIEPRSFHGSSSSLSSTVSRKKKGQAPKPPSLVDVSGSITKKDNSHENADDTKNTVAKSLFPSRDNGSISPRSRKRRPAPLPPAVSNVQTGLNLTESLSYEQNLNLFEQQLKSNNMYCSTPILKTDKSDISLVTSKKIISAADFDNDPDFSVTDVWEKKVSEKEEKNNELNLEKDEEIIPLHHNKSTSGQWKRRKGPAPAIPLLQKRTPGPPMPPAVLRRELQMLEAQQRGLEKQGVRLEELIRERCENNPNVEGTSAEPDPETDELVLQLFELVNEKNELFRRQSELMYIRRQQRLEEEHADLEHQIRILMARPEANKTDSDKAKEEQLIQRLVEVVERRNEVITSLEMDRLREKEEDKTIRERMASHRAKRDENSSISSLESHNKDTLKLEKKKNKKIWIKKGKTKKNDGNNGSLDERPEQTVQKEKKHKKWFHT